MTILQALGFMILGGLIVEGFEIHAWRRYQQGKTEGRSYTSNIQNTIPMRGGMHR